MKFTKALVTIEPMYSYKGEWANKNLVQTADGADGIIKDLHYSDAQTMVAEGTALPKFMLTPIGGIMPQGQNVLLPSDLAKAMGLPSPFIDGAVNPEFIPAVNKLGIVMVLITQKADREDSEGNRYPSFKYQKLSAEKDSIMGEVLKEETKALMKINGMQVQPKLIGSAKVEEVSSSSEPLDKTERVTTPEQ